MRLHVHAAAAALFAFVPLTEAAEKLWIDEQSSYFNLMEVGKAWADGGAECADTGIIDGGFDYRHPAFGGRLKKAYRYKGSMHPGDLRTIGHGTIAASIIGASTDGSSGMYGVCPGVKMYGAAIGIIDHWLLKKRHDFFSRNPEATADDFDRELEKFPEEAAAFSARWREYVSKSVSSSIIKLSKKGVRVISISMMLSGLEGENLARIEEALGYAAEKDVLVVMGAGNAAAEIESYPGAGRSTLIVGCSRGDAAWDEVVERAGRKIRQGTNRGPALDVLAPCGDIVAANPHDPSVYEMTDGPRGFYSEKFSGGYEVYKEGGTSLAVPFAAGLAAMLRAADPGLTAGETASFIRRNSDDLGEPGRDDSTGWGRINFAAALEDVLLRKNEFARRSEE